MPWRPYIVWIIEYDMAKIARTVFHWAIFALIMGMGGFILGLIKWKFGYGPDW